MAQYKSKETGEMIDEAAYMALPEDAKANYEAVAEEASTEATPETPAADDTAEPAA